MLFVLYMKINDQRTGYNFMEICEVVDSLKKLIKIDHDFTEL